MFSKLIQALNPNLLMQYEARLFQPSSAPEPLEFLVMAMVAFAF